MISFNRKERGLTQRVISAFVAFSFVFTSVCPPQVAAQSLPTILNLPAPGMLVTPTIGYTPAIIRGITINPENPLNFTFYVSKGDSNISEAELQEESGKLIKYFLATLTTPSEDLWVNLSPYEKDQMVTAEFGVTEMGRDLLAQDYVLKQLTSSLMYPEDELGQKFWKRVHQKAFERFGTTEIPVETFNKIWIVPERAAVYEHSGSAFVVKSHLKVMLAQDYLALQESIGRKEHGLNQVGQQDANQKSELISELIQEILIPEIEKEVNEGETFANLRQVFNSMILATWFKNNLKETLLGQVYVNQKKVAGVNADDPEVKEKIYQQYLKAFNLGVYNYIKEEFDPSVQKVIPRQYFSGGAGFQAIDKAVLAETYTDLSLRFAPAEVINGAKNIAEDAAMVALDVDLYEADPLGKNAAAIDQAMSAKASARVQHKIDQIAQRTNGQAVAEFVQRYAAIYNAGELEIIGLEDEDRLIQEAIASGELYDMSHGPFGKGTYVGASHPSDVQRVVDRTFVATNNPNDKGAFNNWVKADDVKAKVMPNFRDALGGTKKLYLIPFIMEQEGAAYGLPSFQLTDSRYVALQSLTMAGVGEEAWRTLARTGKFNRGIHLTGDLDKLTEEREQTGVDNRFFISLPEEGLTISYGSNYGGNVLFGKKFEGLRLASWQAARAWDQGEYKMAEHMALIQIKNIQTGEVRNIAFAAPSNSGKTNFAMMKVPDVYKGKYEISPISDDLSHMRIIDGKLMAFNPERGVFGVVTDTDPEKNPKFWDAITTPGKKVIYTNMAYNLETGEIAWKGNDTFPGDITNWRDWQGNLISARPITQLDLDNTKVGELKGKTLANLTPHQRDLLKWTKATLEHPNGRATISVDNIDGLSPDYYNPQGVEVHAIFHGGRVGTKGFEPLVRRLRTPQEGIYSLMTMLVESTAAEVGKVGEKRRDPAAMRPFFSLHEIEYFEHWERMMEKLGDNAPEFFHVNWFAKDEKGLIMWPGYSENMRVIDWALRMLDGQADFVSTPVGDVPTIDENGLDLNGLKISDETMQDVLAVNPEIWKEEAQDALDFLQSLASAERPLPEMFRTINQQILQGFQDAAMLSEVDMAKFQITPKWKDQLDEFTGEGKVINPETNQLKAQLTQKWAGTIAALLRKRAQTQEAVDAGKAKHGFMAADRVVEDAYGEQKTAGEIREENWVVDSVPEPLTRPGAILTGPWGDPKWAINSLSSGAVRVFNDYEDAGWDAGIAGIKAQQTQMDILNGKVTSYQGPKREYTVPERSEWPVLTTRVRGLHFNSKFFSYEGVKTPAIVEDLVSLIVNNRQQLIEQGSGINIVVPKLQSAEELKTVAQIISDIEQAVGLKRGTVKIILMNERIELSLELEEALWAARHHVAVTNVGRWDKLASDIMARRNKSDEIEPNPTAVGVDSPHMEAYINRNVAISLKRGAEPEGGMVVQMMSRGGSHPETDQWVVQKIKSDKVTERNQGMKYAWVATPQVVDAVNEIFQAGDYSNRKAEDFGYTAAEEAKLLELPKGPRTKEGVRKAVYDALAYAIGFRTAGGAVAIVDETRPGLRLMQDLAVLKINYYWLWKLVHHQASLDDSEQRVTEQYIEQVIDEQVAYIKSMADPTDGRADRFEDKDWEAVAQTIKQLVTAPQMVTWESVVMNAMIDEQDADVLSARLKGVFSSRQELESELKRLRNQKQNLRLIKIALAAHDEVFYNPNVVQLTDAEKTTLRVNTLRMVPKIGGILAADESTGSAKKRLDMVGLDNTPENRQEMRRLMLTAPGLAESGINSVILFKETFDNVDLEGRNIVREHLLARGILPGIKTDGGLIPDPVSQGEELANPDGLKNLPGMLAEYKAKGAVFTKWRTVQHISPATGLPTNRNIRLNAVVQAQQAKLTQEAGLVPIVEPEVMFEKAGHDLAASYDATTRTLAITFDELVKAGVYLEGMVLKTSMILAGQNYSEQTDSRTVGYETLKGLLKTVPAKVPAIVFLSGGQDDTQVVENLNEVILASQQRFVEARDAAVTELENEGNNQRADEVRGLTETPWEISYSFGRGLQRPALLAWNGTTEGFEAGQQTMVNTAQQVQAARLGQLHSDNALLNEPLEKLNPEQLNELKQLVTAELDKEQATGLVWDQKMLATEEDRLRAEGRRSTTEWRALLSAIDAQILRLDEAMFAEGDQYTTELAGQLHQIDQRLAFLRGKGVEFHPEVGSAASLQETRQQVKTQLGIASGAVTEEDIAQVVQRIYLNQGFVSEDAAMMSEEQAKKMLEERAAFKLEIQQQFDTQRQEGRHIKRLHTADDIIRVQTPLRRQWRVANHVADKAWGILLDKYLTKTAVNTYGPSDEFSTEAMARSGFEIIYDGGWLAASAAGLSDEQLEEPGYVGRLAVRQSRKLMQAVRKQADRLGKLTDEQILDLAQKGQVYDFYVPFMVDFDTGVNVETLIQEVFSGRGSQGIIEEPLIGIIHIEDQEDGCKRCGHLGSKVLTPTEGFLKRLNDARFQLDSMGLKTLINARTDGEAAEWISGDGDSRDHQFILGVSRKVENYDDFHKDLEISGETSDVIKKKIDQWKTDARLTTIAEAVVIAIQENGLTVDTAEFLEWSKYKSFDEVKEHARQFGINVLNATQWDDFEKGLRQEQGISILWDHNVSKLNDYERRKILFMIESGTQMATARSVAAARYSDILWMEQHHPDIAQIEYWANAIDEEMIRYVKEEVLPVWINQIDQSKQQTVSDVVAEKLRQYQKRDISLAGARQDLVSLGFDEDAANDLIYAATKIKSNNTSPSFNWHAVDPATGKPKMSDLELMTFLKRQAPYSQLNFITYAGAEISEASAQQFAEMFHKYGMLAWAAYALQGRAMGNPMFLDSQGYSGANLVGRMREAGQGKKIGASAADGAGYTGKQFGQRDVAVKLQSSGEVVTWQQIVEGEVDPVTAKVDQAMKAQRPGVKGGIDLNPALLDLQIKRDGNGIPLPMLQQPVDLLKNIEGFIPVIINLTPVFNMPFILGFAGPDDDPTKFSYDHEYQSDEPKAKLEDDVFDQISLLK
ncbi:MAG: phosphoenolpyruvate carboxykinase domain-containing protein [Candidatus Omnitrophota bacterium]